MNHKELMERIQEAAPAGEVLSFPVLAADKKVCVGIKETDVSVSVSSEGSTDEILSMIRTDAEEMVKTIRSRIPAYSEVIPGLCFRLMRRTRTENLPYISFGGLMLTVRYLLPDDTTISVPSDWLQKNGVFEQRLFLDTLKNELKFRTISFVEEDSSSSALEQMKDIIRHAKVELEA